MLIDQLTKPFTSFAYRKVKAREKQLGYRLKLKKLSSGWINGTVIFDMTPVWKKAGMDAIGVNYFTIGNIEDGFSSRFNSKSFYYQAWLGGYIVKFSKKREWSINDHFKLGEADQKNWLSLCGDTNPAADVKFESVQEEGQIKIDKFSGKLYKGIIWSHTDVGKRRKGSIFSLLMAGMAYFFNQSNPGLKLTAQNFIPRRTTDSLLESFQKVCLKGYGVIIDITATTKVVLYGNGVIFTDKNGKKYDTFKKIGPEILRLFKKVEILEV